MSLISYGDLARSQSLQHHTRKLKLELARRSEELASGKTADIGKHLAGNTASLARIEREERLHSAHERALGEAASQLSHMQTSLGALREEMGEWGRAMLSLGSAPSEADLVHAGERARGQIEALVSRMNTNAGGRVLFAGASSGEPALASGPNLLASIKSAVSGLSSINDINAALDTWFESSGGGFETTGYLGATEDLAPVQLGPRGERVEIPMRADRSEVRESLRALASVALAGDMSLSLPESTRRALMRAGGEGGLNASAALARAQGQLGDTQARVDGARERSGAARMEAQQARAALIGVDPYESVTAVQEAQTRMEAVYAVTARLSSLSLVRFLK